MARSGIGMIDGREWAFQMSGIRPPLSLNDSHGNRYAKARIVKSVREEASWRARSARIPRLAKCRVQIEWVVTNNRRRDEDNPAPSAKAVYDGLVDAGIVPDDTPEFMEKVTVKITKNTLPGSAGWHVRVVELVREAA